MTRDAIRRRLGRVVWDISDVEQVATSVCGVILSAGVLTDEERRFLEETVRPEEQAHDASMEEWARRLYGPKPKHRLAYSAFGFKELLYATIPDKAKRFAYAFASLHWNEQFNLRWAPRVIRIFEQIEPAFARQYAENLLRDEPRHVAWGDRVVERLGRQAPLTFRHYQVYHRYLREILPTVISRSHMDVYRGLAEELGR
jgi:hypothetical protein